MTIIRCPKCGYTVSDRAPACPKCKLPLRDALKPTGLPSPEQSANPPVAAPASPSVPPAEGASASTPRKSEGRKWVDAKLGGFYSKIDSREMALKIVRESSSAFFVLAALQALIGVLLVPSVLPDAVAYAILAGILKKWHSRVAAVLLLLVTGLGAVSTLLNRIGVTSEGGKNVFLAAIMLFVAIRAIEGTFKLHGRYREDLDVAG